jgi:predicted nucleic acid-binding protein
MAESIACNASPLIFLAKLGKLSLLDVYDVHVPAQVEAEILQGAKHKKQDASKIIDYLRARRVKPEKVVLLRDLPHSLGQGERSVISLALRERVRKVFIDEAKARTVARFKGLAPKGTLGVLWDAYKSGVVDREELESLMLDLIQKGYRIKEEIIVDFLRKLKVEHRE